MRVDEEGQYWTLEEDINAVFKLHGLLVEEEKVSGNVWTIKAIGKRREK